MILYCIIAVALASPTGKFLDRLVGELMDSGIDIDINRYEQEKAQDEIIQQEQGAVNSRPKTVNDFLAHPMQCVPPADCHIPMFVDICATDDRDIILNPVGMTPRQWVCRLIVHAATGSTWWGSAFKVKISPDLGRTVLFTAAHVIRESGSANYVPRVTIECPGDPAVDVRRNSDRDMWMPDEYLNGPDYSHDYAYITYPGNSNSGFGWKGFIDRNAIVAAGTQLHSCGFPIPANQDTCTAYCLPGGLPAEDKMYCDTGNLERVTDFDIFADVDIDFGHSGGPLYETTGNDYVAYGIVSQPGCPGGRQYERITAERLYKMFSHMGDINMDFRMRGSHNVYLHIDGTGLSSARLTGGDVYAAFQDNVHDRLKIFNVYQSSSNRPDSQMVAIRSGTQDNIYLSLDGTGVTVKLLRGGGMAECRYGIDVGDKETFYKEDEPDGQVAFRSTTFNNVYLRLDHWQVTSPGDHGTVNAQFGKFTLETQHLDQIP